MSGLAVSTALRAWRRALQSAEAQRSVAASATQRENQDLCKGRAAAD